MQRMFAGTIRDEIYTGGGGECVRVRYEQQYRDLVRTCEMISGCPTSNDHANIKSNMTRAGPTVGAVAPSGSSPSIGPQICRLVRRAFRVRRASLHRSTSVCDSPVQWW
jgi:hypothetical protein